MRLTRVIVAAVVAAGVGLVVPVYSVAQAAPPTEAAVAEAERLFNEAVAASERGDFAAALSSFQASYGLNPLPDLLYNIGMCHKALADVPAAANAFREYVAAVGGNLSPDDRAEFDVLLAELVPQVGRVVVEGLPAGAAVNIDGTEVGTAPIAGWVAVSPGRHRVGATLEGFSPFSSEIDVAAGQTITLSASLVAVVPPGPTGPVPGPGNPPGGERAEEGGGLSPWFWTCVGMAGASALTMAITGGLTLKYNDDFDAGGRTDEGLRDTTLALRTTTDVFLGLGLAAVVAGTVLFFVDPGDESEAESADAAGVAVVPSGLVVWW
jgi:hypothetical protein